MVPLLDLPKQLINPVPARDGVMRGNMQRVTCDSLLTEDLRHPHLPELSGEEFLKTLSNVQGYVFGPRHTFKIVIRVQVSLSKWIRRIGPTAPGIRFRKLGVVEEIVVIRSTNDSEDYYCGGVIMMIMIMMMMMIMMMIVVVCCCCCC